MTSHKPKDLGALALAASKHRCTRSHGHSHIDMAQASKTTNRLSSIQAQLALPDMVAATVTAFGEDNVPQAPEDPLFGLMAAYRRDNFERKVDLGIGAYRDDNAKPWVLPVVQKADEILRKDTSLNHEYLPIAGLADFIHASQKLILGQGSSAIKDKRVGLWPVIMIVPP